MCERNARGKICRHTWRIQLAWMVHLPLFFPFPFRHWQTHPLSHGPIRGHITTFTVEFTFPLIAAQCHCRTKYAIGNNTILAFHLMRLEQKQAPRSSVGTHGKKGQQKEWRKPDVESMKEAFHLSPSHNILNTIPVRYHFINRIWSIYLHIAMCHIKWNVWMINVFHGYYFIQTLQQTSYLAERFDDGQIPILYVWIKLALRTEGNLLYEVNMRRRERDRDREKTCHD